MKKLLEIMVCMLLMAAVVPTASMATNWTQMQKLIASDGLQADWFGRSVSLSGDTALIGANGNQEAAYVFTCTGTTWAQQAKLVSDTGYWFAGSVSISGNTALIGSAGEIVNDVLSGSVYVFTRSGTTWTQQAKLTPLDGESNDEFGCSVSIDGNTAIIGAHLDDDNGDQSGSAYIFTRNGTTWTQQAKLLASDGLKFDEFGSSVSISGDTVLIAASKPYWGAEPGSAYVFIRTGTTWTQQAKLLQSDSAAEDHFSDSAVSLDGDTALIGAYLDDDNGNDSGSAYVFTRTGTTWTQQAKLVASDGAAYDKFGFSVSLSGNTALIGAYLDDDNGAGSGSAYVFSRTGTTWTQQAKLLASAGTDHDDFGCSVSLDGNTALIGSFMNNAGGKITSGSAYVFIKGGENEPPTGENIPPVAAFTWTPSTPKANQTITFDASASSDSDGSISLYEWDWNNDGTYEDSHATPTATHSWSQAGSYPVTVRVTDNGGSTNTKTTTVTISSGSQTPTPTPPKPTPGFELIFILGAITISLLLWRKKRIV